MVSPTIVEQVAAWRTWRRQHGQSVEAFFWILLWLVASPVVMACIKALTSAQSLSFPYPWMLIGISNFGTWLLCHVMRCIPGCLQDTETVVPWKQAGALGLLQGFEVGIGADILHRLSITLRTEIHMLCPAFMFIVGLVLGLEPLDPRLVFAVSVVTVGGLLASYGTMTWEGLELVPLALVAALISTCRWVLTQKWLSPLGERSKPSHVVMALRMSPMTALVGFVVAAVREPGAYAGLLKLPYPGTVALLLSSISFGVCLLLVAEMRLVQLTSALLLSFLVPFHNITVILLDASLKGAGAKISLVNWTGILMCAVASAFYSVARKESKEDIQLHRTILDPPANYQSTEAPTGGMC